MALHIPLMLCLQGLLYFKNLCLMLIFTHPTEYRDPRTSFLSILGKSKEEVYSLFGLILAAIGLFGTTIIGIIQLLYGFHFF